MKLAIDGGPPVRTRPFPPHPIVGPEEKEAVLAVLESGKLSTFIASPGEHFLGGRKIREFEARVSNLLGVRFAVAMNSATAALHAAVVACGIQPGDEVVVPPYTFTSTATSVLMHNAIPVFADISPRDYGLDAAAVERAISPHTRAIIPVHLFGHPADMGPLLEIARRHRLRVIEDCAQAPGATYKGCKVGTLGDCSVLSFQETKNIMTGEGGMLLTSDPEIARVAQMVRNHGEMVLGADAHRTYTSHMLGWNYRMTELEAALGIVQAAKLDRLNQARQELAEQLTRRLSGLPGIAPPAVAPQCTHVYYVYAMSYDESVTGIPREDFAAAVRAEGVPLGTGYVRPLYLNPIYQDRTPHAFVHANRQVSYEKGLCPVAEEMHFQKLVITPVVRPPALPPDMDDVADAFEKVLTGWKSRREPQELEARR